MSPSTSSSLTSLTEAFRSRAERSLALRHWKQLFQLLSHLIHSIVAAKRDEDLNSVRIVAASKTVRRKGKDARLRIAEVVVANNGIVNQRHTHDDNGPGLSATRLTENYC